MKVVCISAKAKAGKDFTAQVLKAKLEQEGNKVLIAHYADLLKYICKHFFGWNGEKDVEGRALLQLVGTDVIRKKDKNYWVNFLIGILRMFPTEYDYVLIPDCRFVNEIESMKEEFHCISVRIERPDFDNGLTEIQKNHESETALDDYIFDYKLINTGDNEYVKEVEGLLAYLKER